MLDTIELKNLTIGYNKGNKKSTVISENITTKLRKGELVCLLGPNGAGKSTLIRTLAGMQKPLKGQILIHGEDVHKLAKNKLAKLMSLVLTDRVHGGMLSAYEIVALGRYPHTDWTGNLSDKDHNAICKAIEVVGGEDLIHRSLSELSDGEKQKIMVARALAQDPEIMVLDEITAFLDLPRRIEIMQLMKRMASEENRCILMSSHDMELSLKYADRLWLMPKGGALVTGAPEDLVLNGGFAKAFESEGIRFDMEKGSFETQVPYKGKVSLLGDGNAYIWTAKALERERFEITENAEIKVEILSDDLRPFWRITRQGKQTKTDTIYNLLKIINDN